MAKGFGRAAGRRGGQHIRQLGLFTASGLVLVVGLVITVGVWVGLTRLLNHHWPWYAHLGRDQNPTSNLDLTKVALAVVAGVGAAIALTVTYRRQRDLEVAGSKRRADDCLWKEMNMGKVRTGLSVSLDGFISGPNDGPEAPMGVGGERLLAWYFGGDTEYRLPGTDMVFMVAAQTAEFLKETRETTGALVFGRRTFDLTNGWGGKHPLDVPVFVLGGSVPQEWVYEGSPFTFVTDGLESAVEQAKAVAGDKDVGVGAASIVQQCIKAGLLDEIHLDLVHVLLGGGVSLFDHLGTGPIDLERTKVIEGAGVTHLTFRVMK